MGIKQFSLIASLFLVGFVPLSAQVQGNSHQRIVQRGLPIVFEPAPPQTGSTVSIIARTAGATVGFRPAAIDVYAGKPHTRFEIAFDGAQPTAPKSVDLEQSHTNYLLGNDPAQWRTHVANYGRVIYSNLYRGVDAVFYGHGDHLEHDFIVKPGADYRQIRMHFPRGSHLQLDNAGTLTATLAGASLQMQAPSIYQEEDGKRQERHGRFRLLTDGDIGFTVASYNPHLDLIIDPILIFSTYLSANSTEAVAIAADANGNSYVTGHGTLGYPVTSGAFSGCPACTTNNVVTFISKLSADGSSLVYSTVLGGNGPAQPTGIAVDANGNATVSGWSNATNFPTKSGQPINQESGSPGFLVSLSSDGSSLNYGTMLGSYATAVTVDSAGNAYVTGYTGDGFSVSSGALNQAVTVDSKPNEFDVFLAKFNSGGFLIYSAVLGTADPQNGGGGPVGPSAIAVDSSGDAYVTGQAGTLWPITVGAYLNQIAGTQPYAAPFVMEVAPDAKSVLYSTYLYYAYDITAISVLTNGNVFVVGNGAGASYPTTSNAYEANEANSANGTSFLTELNATGSALVYSTMVCGGQCDVNGMAIGHDGNIWLAGQTKNAQFPLDLPVQSILPNEVSAYQSASTLSEFDPTGHTLEFSTFLGGLANGFANSVAIDPNLHVHVAGAVLYGMYTTPGAYSGSVPQPAPAYAASTYSYVAEVDPTAASALCMVPNSQLFMVAPVAIASM